VYQEEHLNNTNYFAKVSFKDFESTFSYNMYANESLVEWKPSIDIIDITTIDNVNFIISFAKSIIVVITISLSTGINDY
jgi:hypothetical protein